MAHVFSNEVGWWSNRKLSFKFGSVIFTTSAFFLLCLVIDYLALTETIASYEQLQATHMARKHLGLAIHIGMLEARRSEKDFLARKDLRYAALVAEQVAKVLREAGKLETLERNHPELPAHAAAIATLMSSYLAHFQNVVTGWQEKGLDHHVGFQGQFRQAAHELERIVTGHPMLTLAREVLTMRRHEKDYLLRNDKTYVEQVRATVDELSARVQESALPDHDRLEINRLLTIYWHAFAALVNHQDLIEEAIAQMRHDVHQVEPLIERNLHDAEVSSQLEIKASGAFAHRMVAISVSMAIMATVGGIWFSMIAVRSITRPLNRLSDAAEQIRQGGLRTAIAIPQHQDEVGQLARVIDHMVQSLEGMIDTLTVARYQLEQEQDKLTTILLSTRDGIVVTDRLGQVVLVNPAAERILGKTRESVIGEGFDQLIDDSPYLQAVLERYSVDLPETVVYNSRVLNLHATRIFNDDNKFLGSAALIRDVTEEKKLEQQLLELSITDGLTGLLNRRKRDEVLTTEYERASRHGYPLSLLMLDVDHFKHFNDQHGHDLGDRVLQVIAATMRQGFRRTDYCCRYGGEEFSVIMPGTTLDGACFAAEQFRKKVVDLLIDGLQVTVTIGVAGYPQHGREGVGSLEKASDNALYLGKKTGRNRVVAAETPQDPATETRHPPGN